MATVAPTSRVIASLVRPPAARQPTTRSATRGIIRAAYTSGGYAGGGAGWSRDGKAATAGSGQRMFSVKITPKEGGWPGPPVVSGALVWASNTHATQAVPTTAMVVTAAAHRARGARKSWRQCCTGAST